MGCKLLTSQPSINHSCQQDDVAPDGCVCVAHSTTPSVDTSVASAAAAVSVPHPPLGPIETGLQSLSPQPNPYFHAALAVISRSRSLSPHWSNFSHLHLPLSCFRFPLSISPIYIEMIIIFTHRACISSASPSSCCLFLCESVPPTPHHHITF